MANFVSPTGYVDLDNDCEYSIDLKSTRSREAVNPKEDLAFYFDTYIVPKYGLNNINVNNCASFMKDLEMNWTKLDPDLKGKVLDILVDGILSKNGTFKQDLLTKLGVSTPPPGVPVIPPSQSNASPATKSEPVASPTSTFANVNKQYTKSGFGSTTDTFLQIGLGILVLGFIFVLIDRMKKSNITYAKFGK